MASPRTLRPRPPRKRGCAASSTTDGRVVAGAYLAADVETRLREAIDAGDLPGVSLESGPLLAVAGHDGVAILDAWTLDRIDEIALDEPVRALALVEAGLAEPTLYAASGAGLEIVPLTDSGPGLPTTPRDAGRGARPGLERADQPGPRAR